MLPNILNSRFLQIEEIQQMHTLNSASVDTNNVEHDVNEARIENVDNLLQVGGASVNQTPDKNIPNVH
jgi:hypothetical protein